MLLLDMIAGPGPGQPLLFGSYRHLRVSWEGPLPHVELADAGVFHDDDLPVLDPEGLHLLEGFVAAQRLDVAPGIGDRMPLMTRREFLEDGFLLLAYKGRTTVAGFGLPFLLAQLSVSDGEARNGMYSGGFSLCLWDRKDASGAWVENKYRPRIWIKAIDGTRAFIAFGPRYSPDEVDLIPECSTDGLPDAKYRYPGSFLDLRQLGFALTDETTDLLGACKSFGVSCDPAIGQVHHAISEEAIASLSARLDAQTHLLEAMLTEFHRYGLDIPATAAYSPASIGKAHLRGLGIRPILDRQPDFPKDVVGYAMTAFLGGRAETRLRRVSVPVVYTDVVSMYTTVNALTGLARFLTCEHVDVVDDTADVVRFLETVTLDACFEKGTWQAMNVLVQVEPDGEWLPSRTRDPVGQSWLVGVGPLRSQEPLWFALPDVVFAALKSGHAPKVVRALRLVPVGVQPGLAPLKLRGSLEIDPTTTDPFVAIIEERKRSEEREDLSAPERKRRSRFYKVLASATSYGVFAQQNRKEHKNPESVRVFKTDGTTFETDVLATEILGDFAFPPLAAITTAAARLMLGLIELSVEHAGGTYVMCDTDSMAIVATEHGGPVPGQVCHKATKDGPASVHALSWNEVDEILGRFESLNPYDPGAVPGSILKIEDENFDPETEERRQLYCYSISSKRYALYNLDGEVVTIRRASGHGLGSLKDPTGRGDDGWIVEAWRYIVETDGLGMETEAPDWFGTPALVPVPLSSPKTMRAFKQFNAGKPRRDHVRPFGSLVKAVISPLGRPMGVDEGPFQLIALGTEPNDLRRQKWVELNSGDVFRVTARGYSGSRGRARIETYGEVVERHIFHPEGGAIGPDGKPCIESTRVQLTAEPITACRFLYVGKESNQLEEVQAGIVGNIDEVSNLYIDHGNDDVWSAVLRILRDIPQREIVAGSGVSERTLREIRNNPKASPRKRTRAALIDLAARYARQQLISMGIEPARDRTAAIFQWLAAVSPCSR